MGPNYGEKEKKVTRNASFIFLFHLIFVAFVPRQLRPRPRWLQSFNGVSRRHSPIEIFFVEKSKYIGQKMIRRYLNERVRVGERERVIKNEREKERES